MWRQTQISRSHRHCASRNSRECQERKKTSTHNRPRIVQAGSQEEQDDGEDRSEGRDMAAPPQHDARCQMPDASGYLVRIAQRESTMEERRG
jgi:hypothetical protein